MSQIDSVIGIDWGDAQYIGDGVYLLDSTHYSGVPSVAVRTDRTIDSRPQSFVIVLEQEVFDRLARIGQAIISRQRDQHPRQRKGGTS